MSKSYLNNKNILHHLFYFGREIKKGRKVIGYCLNELDFDKEFQKNSEYSYKTSRRIFRTRRDDLLTSKLITIIESKNKRDNFYSITPLGIAFLLHEHERYVDRISHTEIIRLNYILNNFIVNNKTRSKFLEIDQMILNNLDRILATFENNGIYIFPDLLPEIIEYSENFKNIELFIKLTDVCVIRFAVLHFKDDSWVLIERSNQKKSSYIDTLTDKEFYSYLAHFIIFSILYQILFLNSEIFFKLSKKYLDKVSFNSDLVLKKIKPLNDYFIMQIDVLNKNLKRFDSEICKKLKI